MKYVCDAWWREQSDGVAPPSAGVDSLVYGDTFYTHTRCFYVVFVSVSV